MTANHTKAARAEPSLAQALKYPLLLGVLLLVARRSMRMHEYWVLWRSGAPMSFPGQAQYHFWTSFSSLLALLGLSMLLFVMGRRRFRDVWPYFAIWLVLLVASELMSRYADRLSPY